MRIIPGIFNILFRDISAAVTSWKSLVVMAALACGVSPCIAADYASQISMFRRAHGLSSVALDGRLNAVALQQAMAMSVSGKVSHEIGGLFSVRVAKLRMSKAAENIAAGFLTFPETLREWENSAGHRENLLMPGARKVGVASVANSKSPYRMFWAMVITD